MLLWNMRMGFEHAGLDFWLSSIACHAPDTPILVIGTQSDQVKYNAKWHHQYMQRNLILFLLDNLIFSLMTS